jgi:iron complex transport system substrate-binding protein
VRKLAFAFAILLSLGLIFSPLAGCSEPAETPTLLIDDLGRPIRSGDPPQRIISLGPSITEILFALDLGDSIVAVTDYCDYPEEAKSIQKLGAPFPGFSVETILDLEPDLVLSVAGAVVAQLENVGLTVVVLEPPDIVGIYRDIGLVGQLTGRQEEAETLVNEMRRRVDAVVAKTSTATEKPTVFYEVDASLDENNPYTTGKGTFQDSLIDLAGGQNMASGPGWYVINIEEILTTDPDIIILEDYQWGVTPDMVASRASWHDLAAVKEGRVYGIEDSNLTCRPGPRIVDGLEMLAIMIHPELFNE